MNKINALFCAIGIMEVFALLSLLNLLLASERPGLAVLVMVPLSWLIGAAHAGLLTKAKEN